MPAQLCSLPHPQPRRRVLRGRLRRSLRASMAEGVFAEVVAACAGGAVLTGWALHLGLPPVLLGVLGALPFLAQLIHFPAAYATSMLGRRRVALAAVGLSRQAYLPLALLPWLPLGVAGRQALLLGVAALSSILAVAGNNAWVAWMGDLVPSTLRGRYFGRRSALCTLGAAAGTLGAGLFLDRLRAAGGEGVGLAALAGVACLLGALTTLLMARQHEPSPDGGRERPELAAVLRPFASPRARALVGYQMVWNGAVGLAATFFSVYELVDLRLSFGIVALHATAVAVVRMLAAPAWGRAIDRVGSRAVLVVASFAIAALPAIWLLARPDAFVLPLLADTLLSGIFWSAHGLASFHLPLTVAPRQGRPFWLAAFSSAGGAAFAAAAVLGGLLAQALPATTELLGAPVLRLQILFLLSAMFRFGAALLSLRLLVPGTRPAEVVSGALRATLP